MKPDRTGPAGPEEGMPSLVGISLRRALRILEAMGIPATACQVRCRESSGDVQTVLQQRPPPGGPMTGGVTLDVCGRNPIRLLPGVFRRLDEAGGGFLRRLLWPFGQILLELEVRMAEFPLALDPATAPRRFLPWLARLVSTSSREEGGPHSMRATIARAPLDHRRRGTPKGLADAVERTAGVPVTIREGALRSGPARLGVDAVLGTNRLAGGPCFEIHLPLTRKEAGGPLVRRLHRVASAEGPAHARHLLLFRDEPRRPAPPATVGIASHLGGEARILRPPPRPGGRPRET